MLPPKAPPISEAGQRLLASLRSSRGPSACQPCCISLLQFAPDDMLKATQELILNGFARGDYGACSICRKLALVVRLGPNRFQHSKGA